ncbi:MAG: hypothetical protein LBH54_02470 [Clostridiales bacterium]|jgi:V/A-type H+-transporting ATPase subunit I|nr:hypothetical protein [Clostridiales bacterium]
MAVEKMKLINIIGPIAEFDRVVMRYVVDNNIHLENMFRVFVDTPGLYPYTEGNPYGPLLKKVGDTMALAGVDVSSVCKGDYSMSAEAIDVYADQVGGEIRAILDERGNLEAALEANGRIITQVEHIMGVDVPLKEIFSFQHIKIRFGRMPGESYKKLTEYLSAYSSAFFFKFGEDRDAVYGLYCAPDSVHEKVDAIFSSLYFERMRISDKASGTPAEVLMSLLAENVEIHQRLNELERAAARLAERERERLERAYRGAYYRHEAFNVRKYAAHTRDSFYIAGWVPVSEADNLAALMAPEPRVTLLFEEPDMAKHLKPPTKLKNHWLFRPFESFVKMYGLPGYNELDPTALFALTYSLMFGMMYGDAGQGIVLALIGAFLQARGNFIGPILKICGISAAFFGLLFGSVFGFELEFGFMYKPMAPENMMRTLLAAVAMGAVVVGIAMIFNIANGIKQKDPARIFFDANGVAGFVFYWAVIIGGVSLVAGNNIMALWYIAVFVALPLVAVFLKEPLSRLLARRKDWMPKNKGEFFLETFFEVFELILSYITNTISFIRVGAFALNHAGMMMVVYTLARVQQHSLAGLTVGKVLILVVGNVIVLGLEGLLVAIQVLRLEFYEMFSRYFTGDGKPFAPRVINQK